MPAAKSKSAPSTNGAAAKGKNASAASTNGTTTPVTVSSEKKDALEFDASSTSARPDKKVYDVEQDRIKAEIDALQVKLSAVRDKIGLATKSSSGNDRRSVLRSELDGLREQQSGNKASRSKVIDQVKALQDNIQKKIKDLQGAKSKIPYKNVAEVDAQIKNLEKQVESGNMKLADEKRALQEISTCKRNRRTVESFEAEQQAIETDRRAVDELKKQLDDPKSKAISERYDAIKTELDELKKEGDEAYAGRSKLFAERDDLQAQITVLYNEKRDSAQKFREANDKYWSKINEDRARRAERARVQRAADEAQKKQEIAERLREEAQAPAFQFQIEDCQTLIDYFLGKNTENVTFKSAAVPKEGVAGVPKLELRKVEEAQEGVVLRKKKGEDQESYFVGGKGKGKGKKGPSKTNGTNGTAETPSSGQLNIPFPTLSALLSLSIPPPASPADVPRIVEDLKTKKAWFEANQDRVTAENIAKAEADIKRLTNAGSDSKAAGAAVAEVTPPNGGGERPGEPAPTPLDTDHLSTAAPSEEVVEKLEVVKEQEQEAEAAASDS